MENKNFKFRGMGYGDWVFLVQWKKSYWECPIGFFSLIVGKEGHSYSVEGK